MLSDKDVQRFTQEGFLAVPEFFDCREVDAMQYEVGRWIRTGKFRDVSTAPQERQNFQTIPLHNLSTLFRAVPFCRKVADAAGQLIGHPIVKILDQMFYKPPLTGMGTNWHTDNAYFKLRDPMRGVAMWIAIHDATVENGTLKVIPRVFRKEFPHERDPKSDHHIRTWLDEDKTHHCELKAGGVVFFCFGTPHATGSNSTEDGRAGVGIHFVNGNYLDEEHQQRWSQIHLSGPKASDGLNEYGCDVDYQAALRQTLSEAQSSDLVEQHYS